MIHEIQNTLRRHGERDIMSNSEGKGRKLSREILGLFGASAAISLFLGGFLNVMANSLIITYCEKNGIEYTEMLAWSSNLWIRSICCVAAAFIFVVLFLFLVGQRISYLQEIIRGIDALREHRMDYEIPLEGNNEFTRLAESINYLSRTEKELQHKEALLREEREGMIRALSHDIRTPLTTILSYTEYIQGKDTIEKKEIKDYLSLIQKKAEQIKVLTNQLLDQGSRTLTEIEDGRLLLEQLADEWEGALEEGFDCQMSLEDCPSFSGKVAVQELRRIFDNLASNVEKYGDSRKPVYLKIFEKENRLLIEQENGRKKNVIDVESNKIGIEIIRKIAEGYGGKAEVSLTEENFAIVITLMKINSYNNL